MTLYIVSHSVGEFMADIVDQAGKRHGVANEGNIARGCRKCFVGELNKGAFGAVRDRQKRLPDATGEFADSDQFVGIARGGDDHHEAVGRCDGQPVQGRAVAPSKDMDVLANLG